MTPISLVPAGTTGVSSMPTFPISRGGFGGAAVTVAARRPGLGVFMVPALVLGLRIAPAGISQLAYLFLLGYVLLGRRQAVLGLYLLCLCNVLTHAFGGPPGLAAIFRHLITLAAAVSVLVLHVGRKPRSATPVLIVVTALLCGLLLAHALLMSQDSAVSILKSVSFSLVILALLGGWSGLGSSERALLERQIWGTLIGLAVIGFPLAFTRYGYVRTRIGFQGLLVHSQTYGPMMGVLAVYLGMTWITTRRVSKWTIAFLVIAIASVFFSRARIGALVIVAGMGAGMVGGLVTRLRDAPRLIKRRLAMVAAALVLGLIVAGPQVIKATNEFITKYDDPAKDGVAAGSVSITEAAMQSRGFIIDHMMRNIERHPLTGIGFGVATEGGQSGEVQRDPIFGLPIMAAVEKGVMPIAIVEELGIPTACLFFAWLIWLFMLAARGGPVNLAILSAALATNLAEACLFSPGGMGLFFLVVVTMAVTAGPAAARDRRLTQRQATPPLAMAA